MWGENQLKLCFPLNPVVFINKNSFQLAEHIFAMQCMWMTFTPHVLTNLVLLSEGLLCLLGLVIFAVIFLMFLNWYFEKFACILIMLTSSSNLSRIYSFSLSTKHGFFFIFVLNPWGPMHVDSIFLVCCLLLEHRQPIRGYTLKNADSASSRRYTLLLIAFGQNWDLYVHFPNMC